MVTKLINLENQIAQLEKELIPLRESVISVLYPGPTVPRKEARQKGLEIIYKIEQIEIEIKKLKYKLKQKQKEFNDFVSVPAHGTFMIKTTNHI